MTPLIFHSFGPKEAGRFGLVLAALNTIQSIGMSWIYAKSPTMGGLIAQRDRSRLKQVFSKAFLTSTVCVSALSFVFLLFVMSIKASGLDIAQKFSDLWVTLFLVMTTVANSFIFGMAVFMRAHKEEPMMLPSATLAVLMIPALYLASSWGANYIAASYFLLTAILVLPWSFGIFRSYWNREE